MSRRLPTFGLIVAALLAARAPAKSPDLPLPRNDVLAPPAAAEATLYALPAAAAPAEAPLFFRVRPSVRRTLASCLLFGANPLLGLAPTEEYVDFDEDDAPQGTIQALFVSSAVEEPPTPAEDNSERCTGFNINAATEDAPSAGTTPEPIRPTPTATAPDDSVPSVCPWMLRQQQCGAEHSAVVSAEIDLSHDVLHNLEMLREAQTLLQNARELGGAGNVCEAMECLQLAHDLCPGSWLDQRIGEAAAEVFASAYGVSPQGGAAVECRANKKSDKEREIERKLAQPVTLHFDGLPLRTVIDDLRAVKGINIYVDAQALEKEGISVDLPVSAELEEVSLKSALNLILKSAGLTYVVKDEVLQITTPRVARGKRTRVTYAVTDLLVGDGSHPIPPAAGGAPAAEERLIKLITTTVEPREWSANGGPGTIDYYPLTHALVINQTPDIQEQVVDLLESMRRRQPDGDAEEHRDDAPLRQDLPPVDAQVPAILDRLYPETNRPVQPEVGGGEEPESAAAQPGAAKPLPKQGDHEECGCGKDGGAPISCLEVLKEFAAVQPPDYGELWFGLDGSVRMFTQLRQGGAVWHVLYNNGGLSVWASPDGGAPTVNPPDDDSGD